jgi:hypothetical protein
MHPPLPVITSSAQGVIETEQFPPLYATWLATLLPDGVPKEKHATCSDCAMCVPSESYHEGKWAFEPDVKCCSFVPDLPNFLVGGILDANRPAGDFGTAAVEQRIAHGFGVTPLGIGMTASYRHTYQAAGDKVFGRSRDLVCPYFNADGGGQCSIWSHRNSVCATYFCKHMRGAAGKRFWNQLRDLLAAVEIEVALHCALELGVSPSALKTLMARRSAPAGDSLGSELVGEVGRAAANAEWGSWAGRAKEYYVKCAQRVERMTWSDVVAVCGTRVQLQVRATQDSYARFRSVDVPARLVIAAFQARQVDPVRVRIATYSHMDPIILSKRVFDLLHYFDGRTSTRDVLTRMETTEGVSMDDTLLLRMVDYDILRDVSPA